MHSSTNRLITTIGVQDLVVVENNDCILIHKRGRSEDVKKVVNYLKENNYKEIRKRYAVANEKVSKYLKKAKNIKPQLPEIKAQIVALEFVSNWLNSDAE